MASIIEITNPFKPEDGAVRHDIEGGVTIRQWLETSRPGFKEFTHPTICFAVDPETQKATRYFLRAEWDEYVIQPNDRIAFATVHGDPLTIFYALIVVSIVAAVLLILTMPKPATPGQQPQPDSVYSLTGQRNQNRLSHPIEQNFGRNRLFPSYAAVPYNEFQGNDQYIYQLFCVGVGEYDVSEEEALKIEDTPIGSFEDIEHAFYGPGEEVTLFPDNVITVGAISAKELFGPNQTDPGEYVYDEDGVAASDTGQLANSLDVDIVLPAGLYSMNKRGHFISNTITATWEYRSVDAAPGDPWLLMFHFSVTLSTNTPQRFTYKTAVPPGVYNVRANRTNNKDTSARAGNTLVWQALRAFLPSTKTYPGVTMLAVKARATNNLNDNVANRINVIATRKLPVYDTNTPSIAVPTRSIVWSFVAIALAGNTGMTAQQLDLTALRALDTIYTSRGDTFDCIFADKITVWDALKTCARVGRGIPMVSGSVLSIVRDAPKTVPTTIFNQENIVAGSFTWDIKLPGTQEHDGIEIVYVDETTFRDETVLCYFTGDAGETPEDEPINPERIELRGITDRNQAYREGMYLWAQKRYQRSNVSLKTGMEGHIPTYGDMVAVSHDLPRWAAGGMVLSVDPDTKVVELSEPVTFGVGTHKIGFRTRNGGAMGPFTATAGADDYHVVVSALTDDSHAETGINNLALDDYSEGPLFNFGAEAVWSKYMVVVGIAPTSDEEVALTLVNYDGRVFDYDEVDAPALDVVTNPPLTPSLPTVTGVRIRQVPDSVTAALVSWNIAAGASHYVVQWKIVTSSDTPVSASDADWNANVYRTNGSNATIPVGVGYLHVRVAGVNTGQGAWSYAEGDVGVASEPPQAVDGLGLASPFTGDAATISWQRLATATSYLVKVYHTSDLTELLHTSDPVTGTFYSYTTAQHDADCTTLTIDPERDLTFEVIAVNAEGEGPEELLEDIINPAPLAVVGMNSVLSAEVWQAKAVAVGTISGSGNARATLTSGIMAGGPHHIDFAVTASDTPATWAALARAAIAAHPGVTTYYTVSGTGTDIYLTQKSTYGYDSTFNLALADLTCTGITAAPTSTDTSYNTYQLSWFPSVEGDIRTYYVYASATTGFTPGGGNQIMDAMASFVTLNVTKASGAHPAHYWRVGVKDKWGTEITLATEQVILAYP